MQSLHSVMTSSTASEPVVKHDRDHGGCKEAHAVQPVGDQWPEHSI